MAKQSVVDLTKGTLNEENNEELEYVQIRHKRIREICDHLARDKATFDLESLFCLISDYKKDYQRWFYSDVSNYLFCCEQTGLILSNIEALQSYAYKQSFDSGDAAVNDDIVALVDKLWDHANLAARQKIEFDQGSDFIKELIDERVHSQVVEMENSIRKELISLIAIFTALSFIVFGSISSLDNIFEGAKSFPILQVLIIGCIWGICMYNLIFVFVFFIAKLTGLQLSSQCDTKASFSQKYPSWVWGNFVIFAVLAIVALLYFVDYSNSGSWIIIFAQSHPELTTIGGLLLIAAIFILVARHILSNGKGATNK